MTNETPATDKAAELSRADTFRNVATHCMATGGTVFIRSGKTKNAVRSLPLTERAQAAVELLCALWPDSEWLFPGKRGHLRRSSLDHMHSRVRDAPNSNFPRIFVLYSLRHSFATRLADSGASPAHIQKLMGHSSIVVSEKYIHIGDEGLILAMKRKEAFDRMLRGELEEGHEFTEKV